MGSKHYHSALKFLKCFTKFADNQIKRSAAATGSGQSRTLEMVPDPENHSFAQGSRGYGKHDVILSVSRGLVWMVVLQGDFSHKANVGTGFMSKFAYVHVEVYMHAEKVC